MGCEETCPRLRFLGWGGLLEGELAELDKKLVWDGKEGPRRRSQQSQVGRGHGCDLDAADVGVLVYRTLAGCHDRGLGCVFKKKKNPG